MTDVNSGEMGGKPNQETILSHPDAAILSNLGFSASLFLIFILIYSMVRRAIPELRESGLWSWVKISLWLPDELVLALAGLDGHIYLQVLRLVLVCLLIVALPTLLILPWVYAGGGALKSNADFFLRASIGNLKVHTGRLWAPAIFCLFTTAVTIWMVYRFWCRYLVMRQAYLRKPSAFLPLTSIRRFNSSLGDQEQTDRMINLTTRSLILDGVSTTYRRSDLIRLLETMGTGPVVSVVWVKARDAIMNQLAERNDLFLELESALQDFYFTIMSRLKYEYPDAEQLTAVIEREPSINNLRQRCILLREMVMNTAFLAGCRIAMVKKQADGRKRRVDRLQEVYARLCEADQQQMEMVSLHCSPTVSELPDCYQPTEERAVFPLSPTERRPSIVQGNNGPSVSMVSIRGGSGGWSNIQLAMYGHSAAAIVIFSDSKAASIASQATISGRPLSMETKPAPLVQDLLWDRLYRSRAHRLVFEATIQVIYVILHLVFSILISALTALTQLESLEKFFPWLTPFLANNPWLRAVLSGILAPLAFNLLLALAPYLLLALSYWGSPISKSEAHTACLQRYVWLLFIQTFVVVIVSGTIIDALDKILRGKYREILDAIQISMPARAAFFVNIILQKAFLSTAQEMSKPFRVLKWFWYRWFKKGHVTARSLHEASGTHAISLSWYYPTEVILVFHIMLAFMLLTPLMIPAGLIYYTIVYFEWRHFYIYSIETRHESGGNSWPAISNLILIGLLLNQFFTLLQVFALDGGWQTILILLLITATALIMWAIPRTFANKTQHAALTDESLLIPRQILHQIADQRKAILAGQCPPGEEEAKHVDDDNFSAPVEEYDYVTAPFDFAHRLDQSGEAFTQTEEADDQDDEDWGGEEERIIDLAALENPYHNPVVFKRRRLLMLPKDFFQVLHLAQHSHSVNSADIR